MEHNKGTDEFEQQKHNYIITEIQLEMKTMMQSDVLIQELEDHEHQDWNRHNYILTGVELEINRIMLSEKLIQELEDHEHPVWTDGVEGNQEHRHLTDGFEQWKHKYIITEVELEIKRMMMSETLIQEEDHKHQEENCGYIQLERKIVMHSQEFLHKVEFLHHWDWKRVARYQVVADEWRNMVGPLKEERDSWRRELSIKKQLLGQGELRTSHSPPYKTDRNRIGVEHPKRFCKTSLTNPDSHCGEIKHLREDLEYLRNIRMDSLSVSVAATQSDLRLQAQGVTLYHNPDWGPPFRPGKHTMGGRGLIHPYWAAQGDSKLRARGNLMIWKLAEVLSDGSCPASGEYFGIRNKHEVHLWNILAKDSKYDVKKMKLHHTKSFSVIVFHPKEGILIWRDFGNREFSGSGVTKKGRVLKNEEERPGVREGGKEGVFVVWQLETGKKKFLPRIGAPLLYFTESQDPSLSSVSCANNRIHLLKMPSMEIIKSISGIELCCSFPEIYGGLRGGFVFDHSAGLVGVQTESYSIQFYSLFDNHEISQIQVCERSHQADNEVTLVLALTAVSMDGSKLSTAEVKLPEEGIGGLVCLKFWDLGSRKGEFILSSHL
ncbi:hypothetical protein IFM89_032139 [Coptis chinensis]|uniref:Uncharacterized protein n=1 Tax=Coptis chinensis TaxID=261450 RepID=A0A835MBB6_9MAGN|nr:hypothetical protein IFM89_032139 [Coptis chinensis]